VTLKARNGDKPNRLSVFGDSLTNKLPSTTRKRRKREASKKRRVLERDDVRFRQIDFSR
jgi:hypothetical protein